MLYVLRKIIEREQVGWKESFEGNMKWVSLKNMRTIFEWFLGKVLSVLDGIASFIVSLSGGIAITHIMMLIVVILSQASFLEWMNAHYMMWLGDIIKACGVWLQNNYISSLQEWAKIWADQHPEWTDLFNETWNWDDLENPITVMSILTLDLVILYFLLRGVYKCWKGILSFLK